MKTFKIRHVVLSIICILFVALCVYGLNTDCPNTVGYVFCGDSNAQQKVGD